MRTKFILVLAILMAGATTFFFFNNVKDSYEAETEFTSNMIDVYVATQVIERNQKISADMLEQITVPDAGVHPNAIRSIENAEGLYATARIEPDEIILSHRVLSEKEENLFVSRKIEEGNRAVSLDVDFVRSVSNLIEPEDTVDILQTLCQSSPDPLRSQDCETEVIQNDVRVLAVGRKMLEPNSPEDYVSYSAITLELPLDETLDLVSESKVGDISFILQSRIIPSDAQQAESGTETEETENESESESN
ncbi:Flp pilus assembly protein CpaB [Caldalkalibacillus salinus]|uniref:Flp pilus assembly protein CpaB n=1 Tax=Caldalkalibacillus salinus TaxID=2803787 RepID=UPI0023511106|nr:Flp pilus assembly protein CpaB [Caldalkalibacillus salinus]